MLLTTILRWDGRALNAERVCVDNILNAQMKFGRCKLWPPQPHLTSLDLLTCFLVAMHAACFFCCISDTIV